MPPRLCDTLVEGRQVTLANWPQMRYSAGHFLTQTRTLIASCVGFAQNLTPQPPLHSNGEGESREARRG